MYCEDRTTYQCYPRYDTIGKSVGMSRNTVMKYVRELERSRLIKTESTTVTHKDGSHRNGNLLYTILPIQDIVQERFERQLRLAEQQKQLAEYENRTKSPVNPQQG